MLIQDNRSVLRDLNLGHPGYEAGVFTWSQYDPHVQVDMIRIQYTDHLVVYNCCLVPDGLSINTEESEGIQESEVVDELRNRGSVFELYVASYRQITSECPPEKNYPS